ncbi:MAG: translation initiation factor IF-3 [Candidatus Magasanikbacteria bacterium CG10_big_fil_rev_8_21_14_0_10_36_32]|uniref:Translation initiation factor IF-3 n=1 Tax=Candidatus Magasanikbacteria bacterium CG10_big_fil_rev_8_21_14_0_10_36_32 TaxID=1974646 RepID=A0A2M6W5X3_9BACT|nr:MAG: translation initiation factor IF-3 [Candidatus Magasanikbacteria bacterium CG10_big_fil_rev_8_21_14_0_10_36_32]
MRISRRRRPKIEPKKQFVYNEGIKAPVVLVLGSEGEHLGTLNTGEAIRLAREQEMDLVEINPKADPPVAKIMNFGQYQYQQEKADRLKKAHQHVIKTKCVKLSLRIGQHDLEIRKNQALEFLNNGHKVKMEVFLRGREMQQGALAMEMLKKAINEISAIQPIRFEQDPERQGNVVTATFAKN